MKVCKRCNKQYSYGGYKYCSLCRVKRHRKRNYMSSGISWAREKIRKRDNYTCQLCGKKWIEGQRRLDVHHIDYNSEKSFKYESYKDSHENLITLCHKCHGSIHKYHRCFKKLKLSTTINNNQMCYF